MWLYEQEGTKGGQVNNSPHQSLHRQHWLQRGMVVFLSLGVSYPQVACAPKENVGTSEFCRKPFPN